MANVVYMSRLVDLVFPSAAGANGIKRVSSFLQKHGAVSAKLRPFLFFWVVIATCVCPLMAAPHVTATIIPAYTQVVPGSDFPIDVRLVIDPGWHIYGEHPGEVGVPTKIRWRYDVSKVTLSDMSWPTASRFETAGIESFGYENTVHFPFTARVSKAVQLGDSLQVVADIRWVACDKLCIPESVTVTYSVNVGDRNVSNAQFRNVGLAVSAPVAAVKLGAVLVVLMALAAFLGGLILNVMPCVFPVLSLKLFQLLAISGGHVDGVAQGGIARTLRRNILAYAMGIMVSFWMMTAVLLVLRHTLGVVGWGIQLQYPIVVFSLMLLFLLLALNFFGLFEIGLSLQKLGQPSTSHANREFWSGVLIVLVATPCTAPFLGAAIGFALAQPAWVTFAVLTAMGLGLSSPMVVLSVFPGLLRRLPRPGDWMIRVRQFLGFPMLASVIWLLWVLLQQWGEAVLVPMLGLLLCLALGVWAVGVCQEKSRFRLATWLLVGLLLLSGVAYRGLSTKVVSLQTRESSAFIPFTKSALQAARESGKPVFVDVTASWCLTCQVNKKLVLETKAAAALFAEHGVVLMQADWTSQDDVITKYLASFGRSGVPMYVYYAPGKEGVVLPEVLRLSVLGGVIRGE